MRSIDEVTHNGKTLREILDSHALWLKGEGGKRANLRYANLYNANLRYANLSNANLYNANLSNANLYNANLYDANLSNANLYNANLYNANLYKAYLSNAYLRNAYLRNAYLSNANLSNANLLALGNMAVLRTLQIDTWMIGYTSDTLQIGCQRHAISKWRKWDTPAGRKWIANMDDNALEWADKNLALVLQIIDTNPATKHAGHVEKE